LPWIIGRAIVLGAVGLFCTTLGPTWSFAGWGIVLVAILSAATSLFELPSSVRAWRIGADGEERTARLLAPLEAEGFVILHDRRLPGRRENVDHVVIGPPGVFVVETKSYEGRIRVRRGELFIGGRRKNGFIDQVERQREAVSAVLGGVEVRAVICVHRAEFPWFRRLEINGTPILPAKAVASRLRSATTTMGVDGVAAITASASEAFPPAARRPGHDASEAGR
jgi:hypothetical protein